MPEPIEREGRHASRSSVEPAAPTVAAPTVAAPTVAGPPAAATPIEHVVTAGVALLALLTVAPLLAWVFGLGRFSVWFALVAAPSLAALAAIGWWLTRTPRFPRLRTALVVGSLGGLVGTVAYDVVRVPFVALGVRLFAPIDSYGILLVDAPASSGLTDLAGWAYHFANGICFGIAYACVMLGRSKWWAVGWALVLESAAVFTPFAVVYGLRANPTAILFAYGAHVPYGLAVGFFAQRGDDMVTKLREVSPRPVVASFAALAVVLLLWLRPAPPYPQAAATEVRNGRFEPAWVRVAPGGCAHLTNRDDTPYRLDAATGAPSLPAGGTVDACFAAEGVLRVRTSDQPYSGGYVLVDPALADQEGPQT